ncbi:MAG: alpha/beta fold hydrolase [Candidatus Doudnabacteria bacterium]|nr:alpha/beta fold hydrolase [Candidatus Doudnabacteria bacterium]
MIYKNAKFVNFKATDNLPLPGLLFKKNNNKKILINLHGNGGASVFYRPDKYQEMANDAHKAGWDFFAFNNRGSGITNKIKIVKNGKLRRFQCGTSHELIGDCIKDIDGAINFLKTLGYKTFALSGFSTGANKICVYHYKKPRNQITKNLIICGADDAGIYYNEFGKKKFFNILKLCKQNIKAGKGKEFMDPKTIGGRCYSYQGMYDILNPEGLYNTFPFWSESQKINFSKKPAFREIKAVKTDSLIIYGGKDEYSFGQVEKNVSILKNALAGKSNFGFEIIKNADHGFTGKERELGKLITNFLKS